MVTKVKGASSHIINETKDPDVASDFIGQVWVNNSTDRAWIATTAEGDVNDWVSIDSTGGVASATETSEGVIELATQAETDAGTDDARAITPLKLASYSGLSDFLTDPSINNQTGTSYTLVLSDYNTLVRCNNASAISLTVPAESSVNYDVGTVIQVRQVGAGQVTLVEDTGVTINTPETLISRKQGSTLGLIKVGADEWDLTGDMEAA